MIEKFNHLKTQSLTTIQNKQALHVVVTPEVKIIFTKGYPLGFIENNKLYLVREFAKGGVHNNAVINSEIDLIKQLYKPEETVIEGEVINALVASPAPVSNSTSKNNSNNVLVDPSEMTSIKLELQKTSNIQRAEELLMKALDILNASPNDTALNLEFALIKMYHANIIEGLPAITERKQMYQNIVQEKEMNILRLSEIAETLSIIETEQESEKLINEAIEISQKINPSNEDEKKGLEKIMKVINAIKNALFPPEEKISAVRKEDKKAHEKNLQTVRKAIVKKASPAKKAAPKKTTNSRR